MRVNFVEVWRRLRQASPSLRRPTATVYELEPSGIRGAKYFAINVLTADQRELSQRFSSTVAGKFDGVGAVSGHGGIPLINGCAFDHANVRLGSKPGNSPMSGAMSALPSTADVPNPTLCESDSLPI
jgi:hypothetical protein